MDNSKSKKKVELRILHALPASGKSSFAEQYKKEHDCRDYKVYVADVDKFIKEKYEDETLSDLIDEVVSSYRHIDFSLIMDGLFLTNENIIDVINKSLEYFDDNYEIKIVIDTWVEDRDACLINDKLRNRSESAATTIKNAAFEIVDLEKIKSNISDSRIKSIKKNKHYVYSPTLSEVFFVEHNIKKFGDENKIYGERWCTGGAYGNCWDSSMSPVSPSDPPKYFSKLVDILDNLKFKSPLSIHSYFDIMDECVDIVSTFEADYYGGGTYESQYVLDLTKFYDYLNEHDLI